MTFPNVWVTVLTFPKVWVTVLTFPKVWVTVMTFPKAFVIVMTFLKVRITVRLLIPRLSSSRSFLSSRMFQELQWLISHLLCFRFYLFLILWQIQDIYRVFHISLLSVQDLSSTSKFTNWQVLLFFLKWLVITRNVIIFWSCQKNMQPLWIIIFVFTCFQTLIQLCSYLLT